MTNAINASDIETVNLQPALYLLPVALSEGNPSWVLPALNLEIFDKIKHFVVENKRTARRFLKKINKDINIDTLSMVELNEHTDHAEIPDMLRPIADGYAVGVMSEAGCPAVADPGAQLVEIAQRRGIRIIPLVGPSSILLALMASGMNGQKFTFHGYLPVEDHARDSMLKSLASMALHSDTTQIFIETPYRNNRLLERMSRILPPDTKICVACDITGMAQSILTRTARQWQSMQYDYNKKPTIFLIGR